MTEFEGAIEITIIIVGGASDETTRNINKCKSGKRRIRKHWHCHSGSGRKELRQKTETQILLNVDNIKPSTT